MKIAFFTDLLLPPLGGIERHVLDTAQALTERGHEVKVFYPGQPVRSERVSNKTGAAELNSYQLISSLAIPASFVWPNLRLSFPLHLYFSLREWRPEVIHFHTAGPTSLAGVIVSRWLKRKSSFKEDFLPKPVLVGTFHSYFASPEYLSDSKWLARLTRRLHGNVVEFWSGLLWRYARWFYNLADVVISPSTWVAKDLKERGVNKTIRVIANGVDLDKFGGRAGEEAIRSLREKYHLSENTFLYVGRLSREKSLDVLWRAFKMLTSDFLILNCDLLIVGDGPARPELERLNKELGITSHVHFLGQMDHEGLAESGVYEASKTFVTASTSENQPLTILEAMAKGLPVIGPLAQGIPDLVKNGQNGFLFEPGDAQDLAEKIEQLIINPSTPLRAGNSQWTKMSERARSMAQEFSLEKAAARLESLYLEKLENPR